MLASMPNAAGLGVKMLLDLYAWLLLCVWELLGLDVRLLLCVWELLGVWVQTGCNKVWACVTERQYVN